MEIDKQKKKEMFFEITDSLTSLELAEYIKDFKERYGIKEETIVSATTSQVEEQKETSTVNVSLKILEVSKEIKKALEVYKMVKEIVNNNVPGKQISSVMVAKGMIDEGRPILESTPKEQAEKYQKQLEERGAKVELTEVK